MSKEYTITEFRPSDFKDNYGNTWCDLVLQGEGEPVRIVVKDPTTIKTGDVLYGDIKEQVGKSGKPYLRFYRAQREDANQQSFAPKKDWQPRTDHHEEIKAQWAIGQAVQYQPDGATPEDIEEAAKVFFAMVDRVKGSSESADPKALSNPGGQTDITTTASGYEKAKAARQSLQPQRVNEEEDVDAEYESLVKSAYGADQINLDEIPF